uniref:Uncharacterized protein n=1 Tax=uncultured Planctomycetota bacterium TaxID=120965 RepID=H5SDE7_9BACT|nr:hypothetical protein HGMM_F13D05C05 [uncultured Planctomycetota bacterium]
MKHQAISRQLTTWRLTPCSNRCHMQAVARGKRLAAAAIIKVAQIDLSAASTP